ncbi:hypothetical protein HK096_001286 [Nowakowskiella sp. JEL0078]|nr:hypothetical protein HK096_001286 [Nowakowskiella sp. JEL0078]
MHAFEQIILEDQVEYKIYDRTADVPNSISLKSVVKAFAPSVMMGKSIRADHLYLSLGKLRSTQYILQEYNKTVDKLIETQKISTDTISFDSKARLARYQAMEFFSVVGFQVLNQSLHVTVVGLDELVHSIEKLNREKLSDYSAQISSGMVNFEALGELFKPGTLVSGVTSLGSGGIRAGFLVRSGFFEESRTLFGKEKCFRLELECIVGFGRYFIMIRFEEVFSGWSGAKVKAIKELPYFPFEESDVKVFNERGDKYINLIHGKSEEINGCRFVQYRSGGFYPHRQQKRSQIVASSSTGRIVIDCERGLTLGHFPSQGSDEVTLAMMNAANRYKRMMGDALFSNATTSPPNADSLLLFTEIPESLRPLLWPALVGFSFSTKGWGHVLVDSLDEIAFNDNAFDLLVLEPERKRLIKALVMFGGKVTQAKFQDIVSGKAGGSVFLLHGPPGVGKTLTAEAIAELLRRPLYYVTMGELGTDPEEMEKRLGSVLELCDGWDAIVIIDEADVFLEKRASGSASDVVRNAMVCVMLRLIEYHQGILFLTTNRVLTFDPAFESRVTVALKYDHLGVNAREQVWRNLIANLIDIEVGPINFEKLAEEVLNGRQIKNTVRLALALAVDEGSPLTQKQIEKTMAITSLGRMEMSQNVPEI